MKKCRAGQQQQYSVFAVDPESFGKDPILKDKVPDGRKNQNCHIKMDKTYKEDRDFIHILRDCSKLLTFLFLKPIFQLTYSSTAAFWCTTHNKW